MQQVISHDMMATLTVNESDLDLCSSTCGSFLGAMESLELIEKGFRLVADLCIKGIQVNAELARKNAEMSTSLATMVSALYGYPIGTKIAHKAFNEGKSCKEVALEEGLIDPKIAEELFDVRKLADRKETIEMFRKYSSLRKID